MIKIYCIGKKLYLCTRMIKKLLHIWFSLTILVGILAGCHDTPQYDSRLTIADSLMTIPNQRHVAMEQLLDIQTESLTKESDKAYYALLITQARYLNHQEIPNDDEINIAIDFFKSHTEDHEKFTRAHIFKGTVLEGMGDFANAMHYYKEAESIASEEDSFNRGYALLRMGKLYTNHHAYDGRDIEKLEQALSYFRQCKDTIYQIICLKELGALYRSRKADIAENLLNEAITLAEKRKDSQNIINCNNILAYLYFMQGQTDHAYNKKAYKQLQRIKAIGLNNLPNNVYTTFACVYANTGKSDSAMWFLDLATQNDSSYRHSTSYLEAMGQIAKARGDMYKYYKLSHESDSMSFSSLSDPHVFNIITSEVKYDENQKYQQEKSHRNRLLILALISSILLLLALLLYRRSHRYDKLVLELKDQSHDQMQDLTDMQQSINELQINDERLKGFISSHIGMMRDIIEACYHEPNNRIAENMKRIVKFQDSNKDNWVKLFDYIDLEHNNIMTRTRENYPDLNDRELLLLALTCMGFTYIQIAIIMGYSNATSVSVIKQRLVKKMGLDCSLNEYIQNNDNMKK